MIGMICLITTYQYFNKTLNKELATAANAVQPNLSKELKNIIDIISNEKDYSQLGNYNILNNGFLTEKGKFIGNIQLPFNDIDQCNIESTSTQVIDNPLTVLEVL